MGHGREETRGVGEREAGKRTGFTLLVRFSWNPPLSVPGEEEGKRRDAQTSPQVLASLLSPQERQAPSVITINRVDGSYSRLMKALVGSK